ncbi:hypothetical protein F444_04137 [Phytophthora nicotianae P1976]|uniref:Uncharacterized protein n=1 Tax=Phytophthora nicotianae P1976 TaxID=1317066 RepID=A0A081ARS4_PHYNI|nr:hypothetical protein F444_04137 [Phytophthora nicotianae P1976]
MEPKKTPKKKSPTSNATERRCAKCKKRRKWGNLLVGSLLDKVLDGLLSKIPGGPPEPVAASNSQVMVHLHALDRA